MMFQAEGGKIDHLFSTCREASSLWDKGETLFICSYRIRNGITKTMEDWRQDPFANPILDRV